MKNDQKMGKTEQKQNKIFFLRKPNKKKIFKFFNLKKNYFVLIK
jgi:hypothetical protein